MTETTNPENYGCGFLSGGTLVTSDVGDQFPAQPATGQLILWFPPFDRSPGSYCKIDIAIPTAGGIHVDAQDGMYVAANRDAPGAPLAGRRAGVHRYSGDWPTSNDAAGGCGRRDPTGAALVDEARIEVERFIGNGIHLATPSAIAPSQTGGFYVSSVIDGKISEYDASGHFVREIVAPPVTEVGRPPYSPSVRSAASTPAAFRSRWPRPPSRPRRSARSCLPRGPPGRLHGRRRGGRRGRRIPGPAVRSAGSSSSAPGRASTRSTPATARRYRYGCCTSGAGAEAEETSIESSPLIHDGVVYVGMDTHGQTVEETGGARPGLLAVDAATGRLRWRFDPERGSRRSGCGGVWSSPTLEPRRGLVFVATGNCSQDDYPWTPTSRR